MKNPILKYSFFIIVAIIFCHGCCFDELYFSNDTNCRLITYIDWSKIESPLNGTTAYIYQNDGKLYKVIGPHPNPSAINISLPEGEYNIVLHNNSIYELSNVSFEGIDNAETFNITAKTLDNSKYNILNVSEPNEIGLAHILDLGITENMITYFPYKPEYYEQQVNKKIFIKALPVTPQIEIIVNVKGLNNAAGAPVSELKNLVGGIYPLTKNKLNKKVTQEFILNNRIFSSNGNTEGIISKKIFSFGFHDDIEERYTLCMNFILVNGDKYPITIDITNYINQIEDSKYKIELECTLPDVPSIGDGGSGFNPDVEEWENIEVDVPM